jgi:hypothetical protein
MKFIVEMGSDGVIYVPSLMKICSGIQVLLRLLFFILNGCSVGITNMKDL